MNMGDNECTSDLGAKLAYRDEAGKLTPYAPGDGPTVWLPDGPAQQSRKELSANVPTDNDTEDDDSHDGRVSTEVVKDPVLDSQVEPSKQNVDLICTDAVADECVNEAFVPEVRPPRRCRKEIMPDEMTFKHIDEHAMKVPSWAKENIRSVVQYLTREAKSPLEQVRAFYVWIAHNISYDTAGYFGRAPLQPTDPESVLANRLTVCEGYVRLMEAFCREVDILVKNISGYAKAFNSSPDKDVTADQHNAHAWNAVYINDDWFLLDVTWGAGYMKTAERRYISQFNNAYFFTDPDVFLTDHLPATVNGFEHFESTPKWQLVKKPVSKEGFVHIVNFDKCGKEWGIRNKSHYTCAIYNIEKEIDIVLEESYVKMLDYVAFLFEDGRKMDTYAHTFMLTDTSVNIRVCFPRVGTFALQVYGRRLKDGPHARFQPIVKYLLHCQKTHETPIPYPFLHTMYGPARDLELFGVADVGQIHQHAEEGELIVAVKPIGCREIVPRLYYQDQHVELRDSCFVDYSECFDSINIIMRFSHVGYYKLMLLAKRENSSKYALFMTYLIKCTKACSDGLFPVAHANAFHSKCCLIEPLTRCLTANSEVSMCIKCPELTKVRCLDTFLQRTDDVTFEGVVAIRSDVDVVSVEGCDVSGTYHKLYSYTVASSWSGRTSNS